MTWTKFSGFKATVTWVNWKTTIKRDEHRPLLKFKHVCIVEYFGHSLKKSERHLAFVKL